MAGGNSMANLAEVLAKTAGKDDVAQSVSEALDKYLTRSSASTTEQMSGLATQLSQLRQASQQQASAVSENTAAVTKNTSGNLNVTNGMKPSSALSSIFGSGFAVSPLVSGIWKLFGGGSDGTDTAAPVEYEKPAAVNIAAGYSSRNGGSIYALDYAVGDRLRLMAETAASTTVTEALRDVSSNAGAGIQPVSSTLEQLRQSAAQIRSGDAGRAGGTMDASSWEGRTAVSTRGSADYAAPQITVQVQAMDSRSFLDHSEEIARAVRQAMLNSNGINDVITEL